MRRYTEERQNAEMPSGEGRSESVSMMERGRVREAVTCEWFTKAL